MTGLTYPRQVELADITIRDGFQHEEKWIPTAAKLWIAEELILAGYRRIEVTNLGNPKGMPQFADADDLIRDIRTSKRVAKHISGVELTAITIRERAVERAIELKQQGLGPDCILMMVSTSASHMKKNSGLDHAGYWAEAERAIEARRRDRVNGTVSTIWGCPSRSTSSRTRLRSRSGSWDRSG
jgi:hydroxymethylglutaryl-CoA lyase